VGRTAPCRLHSHLWKGRTHHETPHRFAGSRVRSTFRRLIGAVAGVLLVVVAYLLCWPVPAEPVSWLPQTPPGFTGVFAPNTQLSGLRIINVGKEVGPEHIAMAPDGRLYAAMASGNVL